MKEYYNITGLDPKQPLLEVVNREYYTDQKKKNKVVETCFLVPELCRFVKNLKDIQAECKDKEEFKCTSKAIKIPAE